MIPMTRRPDTLSRIARRTLRVALRLGLCSALALPLMALGDDEVENGEEDVQEEESGSLRRSDRMEFDARLVRGQKATSGAVYLFQRAPRPLPPLVVLEQSYLDRIVEPVLGSEKKDLKEAARE